MLYKSIKIFKTNLHFVESYVYCHVSCYTSDRVSRDNRNFFW